MTVLHRTDASITLKFCDTKHVLGNRHVYIPKYGEIEAYIGVHDDHDYDDFGPHPGHYLDLYFDRYYEDTW